DEERFRFGLLLALGDVHPEELPAGRRQALPGQLARWYAEDPHSSVHGACGWLLRHWGRADLTEAVDRTPLPYDAGGRREWFVQRVGPDHFTFVAFRPGTYWMGSPESEPYRRRTELRHQVRLTRAFAVCDRELTRGQYARFLTSTSLAPPDGDEPAPDD